MDERYIDDSGNEIICQSRNDGLFLNTVVAQGKIREYISDGCDPSGKDLGPHPSGFHYVGNIHHWLDL